MSPLQLLRRPSRSKYQPPATVRAGFTLLETLLALVLTTLLMVSIVASTTLYAQYRYRGLEGARQAKVLLGTFCDLQNDLRACYNLSHGTNQSSSNQSPQNVEQSNLSDTSLAQERVLSFAGRLEQPVRFIGRENAILLLRHGTNARFAWNDFYPTTSEYQVLWMAPGTSAIRLPYALEQLRPIEQEYEIPLELGRGEPALHRYSKPIVNRLATREPWQSGAEATGGTWEKNLEIQHLAFRFFDGTSWLRQWNSHLQEHRLPVAIEIQLKLTCTPNKTTRLVVNLPK